jgi:2,4-dienoyl-CoA reductase (NADPH2)
MTTELNGAGCSVNPRAGREAEYPLEPAAIAKKVLVIGGGPGGLAAAMYASERGHAVTLIERQRELGGAFRFASTLFPGNQLFLDYLMGRVADLPIDVILGEAADPLRIESMAPDAIIVATGGHFRSPALPGSGGDHVISGAGVIELIEMARASGGKGDLPLGERIAIVGANLIGIELAEYLAKRGKRVHLLEPTRRMAEPAGKKRRGDHSIRLDQLGVPVNTGVAIAGLTPEGVMLSLGDGREHLIPADTVVVVGQPEPDSTFLDSVSGLAPAVHAIGDTTGFGLSKKAVTEALQIAYTI